MTTIAWFLALAALYIGWVYIRVVIEVYRHTKAMANSDYAIERFEPVAGPSLEQIPPGFEPHENLFLGFAGNPIQLDSWYNPASGRYLSHYQGASCNFIEYVTRFEGDVLLTTSNQFNDCMPAAPGNYRQCFSVNEPNELLQHHENSEKYLIEQGHRVLFDSFNFEKELRRLSTLQAEATMAKQLWPLRYAFMYMFRIRPKHGLTVREQALPKS